MKPFLWSEPSPPADFQERMRANGGTPLSSTPEELAKHMRSEIVRCAKAVKDSGTTVE